MGGAGTRGHWWSWSEQLDKSEVSGIPENEKGWEGCEGHRPSGEPACGLGCGWTGGGLSHRNSPTGLVLS